MKNIVSVAGTSNALGDSLWMVAKWFKALWKASQRSGFMLTKYIGLKTGTKLQS